MPIYSLPFELCSSCNLISLLIHKCHQQKAKANKAWIIRFAVYIM
uniref:Uncharacterized protein n=1 Tax=Tetranychus urticae TaxID=32264 RepID=T1JRX6_TETUR